MRRFGQRQGLIDLEMRKLLPGMNTRIGTATTHDKDRFPKPLRQGSFNGCLHANSVGLRLPAVVGRSPIG